MESSPDAYAVATTDDGISGAFVESKNGAKQRLESADGYDLEEDIERIWVSSLKQKSEPSPTTYAQLNNAQWGSSVDINDDVVVVGAPGKSAVVAYNLKNSTLSQWTVRVNDVIYTTLRSIEYINKPNEGFGADIALDDTQQLSQKSLVAGAVKKGNSGSAYIYTASSSSLSGESLISPNSGLANERFGDRNSIDARGNVQLIGAAGAGSGAAYLFVDTSSVPIKLLPYRFNSSTNITEADTTSDLGFGKGSVIISDGFYAVGSANTTTSNRFLYNFRQRGPAWTSNAGLVTTAAPLERAKLGSAVDIAGTTAVIGAPDYGNHGAVFVFTQDSTDSDNPTWDLQAQINAPGFWIGSDFGADVAIDGDFMIVGAPGLNQDVGGAYIFSPKQAVDA